MVEVRKESFSGMLLLDNETVAFCGVANSQFVVIIYSLSRGCRLCCIELDSDCDGITCVKMRETLTLAMAFPSVIV